MSTASIGSRAGTPCAQPLAEEAHDPLGDGGQRVEPRGALGALGQGVDLLELVAHRPEHRGAVGVDERLVEPAEPHAAGEVADDREAQLGGGHQAVEQLAGGGLVGRGAGAGSTSQRCRIEVAIDTSGAERCWARKTRNTAPSRSSLRSTPVTP